ncbi:hypothetical protein HDV63DRAFT_415331 [Trichoderma sp. SZMC 28014]
MASEFHQFTSLPTEIRLRIWKYALRPYSPSRPGVHFFSVTNSKEDGDELANFRVQCALGSRCEYNHGESYYLAAPKFGISNSWTNNNPSSYLWDFGMWSACSESQKIIKDHYKMEQWAAKLLEDYKKKSFSEPDVDACVPVLFPRIDEDWRFAIYPNRDLVCLQPLNPNTVGYYRESIQLMDDICMVNRNAGLRGMKHLAFEYDPSWCDDLKMVSEAYDFFAYIEEKSPRGLFIRILLEALDSVYEPDSIWLIDYGLKRNTQNRDDDGMQTRINRRKRMTFYGNNQNFVEADWESRSQYEDTERRSALDFLDELDGMLCGFRPDHMLHHYQGYFSNYGFCEVCDDNETRGYQYCAATHVRVLACEPIAERIL